MHLDEQSYNALFIYLGAAQATIEKMESGELSTREGMSRLKKCIRVTKTALGLDTSISIQGMSNIELINRLDKLRDQLSKAE